MLELFGRGYVIQHCVASFRKKQVNELFMCYVGEGIKIISENTANFCGGSSISVSFYDMLHPVDKKKQKTAQEVIDHLRSKLD